MNDLIEGISSYLNAKDRGGLYLVSSTWYDQMYQSDKRIIDDLVRRYPNQYDILQYSLLQAIQADDVSLVKRVVDGLSSYVPLRWTGIPTHSNQMHEVIDRVRVHEDYYESMDDLASRADRYSELIDIIDKYQSKEYTNTNQLILLLLDSGMYEFYNDVINMGDGLYDMFGYNVVAKYNPLEILPDLITIDNLKLIMRVIDIDIVRYIKDDPVLNEISYRLNDLILQGEYIGELLALSVQLGLIELVDRYMDKDNALSVYGNTPMRVVTADTFFTLAMYKELEIKDLHPEWVIQSVHGTSVENVPLDFWKKLIANAIGYSNINMTTLLIENGSDRINKEGLRENISRAIERHNWITQFE